MGTSNWDMWGMTSGEGHVWFGCGRMCTDSTRFAPVFKSFILGSVIFGHAGAGLATSGRGAQVDQAFQRQMQHSLLQHCATATL